MGVDFEERVDYRRLHRYRLARAKKALENSELGALLVFDVNNIRYITSTKIGEWERDKLSRWALLTRGGEPIDTTAKGEELAAKYPHLGMSGELIGKAIARAAGMLGLVLESAEEAPVRPE